MGFISPDRKQQVLFGYSLDEFVPADARCRFVVDLVARLDLHTVYADYSDQGGDAYDPAMMLAAWFLAYTEGVTSTRELEQRCLRDMHFIYVSGNLKPDHTSLSRFRKRHLERLPDLFVQIVRLAKQRGLSQFKAICIDGTRLKANANPGKSLTSEDLQRGLEKIRARIKEYLKECELSDGGGVEQEDLRRELARLKTQQEQYENRLAQIEKRKATLKPGNRKGHRINLTDPDALKMKAVNGRRGVPGFNGQISVDAESGLIVAAEAVTDANDSGQFSEQHAKVEDALGKDSVRKYVTDSGYHSLDQLQYADKNGIDAVIDDPRPDHRSPRVDQHRPAKPEEGRRVKRADFAYDSAADEYVCPMGERLVFRNLWTDVHGYTFRVYGRSCVDCSHRAGCTGRKGTEKFKRIFRNALEPLAEAMAAKAESEEGKALLNLRFATAETVFGNLKENLGFRGVRLRGIAKVKGEFLLMCIGHNLNRLFSMLGPTAASPENHSDSSDSAYIGPFGPVPGRIARVGGRIAA